MSKATEIKIILNADGTAAIKGVEQVTNSVKKMESETKSIVSRIKSHWLGISATIAGAMVVINQAWNLAEMAAQFEEQKASLNALAAQYNTTASQIINSVKEASNGLISMADAASVSAKALMMGLNPQQLVEFMKIVEATTNITGASVSESFERIIEASVTGREIALQQMGIILDTNEAYKKYAVSIGKTAEKLNEAEKQQAIINAVLAKGSDIMSQLGSSSDSVDDKMTRLKVTIEDLKLHAGALIIRVGVGLVGAFNALMLAVIKTAQMLVAPFALLEKGLNKLGMSSTFWQDTFKEQQRLAEKYTKGMVDNFSAMIAKSEDIALVGKRIKDIGVSAGNTSEDIDKLNKQIQDLIDKGTMSEVELIKKQAKEWEKLGADKVKIEQWVAMELEKLDKKRLEEVNKLNKQIQDLIDERSMSEVELIKKQAKEWEKLGADKVKIEQWVAMELEKLNEKHLQDVAKTIASREELERNLTLATASEIEKRLLSVEDWTKRQLELAKESFTAFEDFEKAKTRILEIAAEMRAKIYEEESKTFQQGIAEGMNEFVKSIEWGFDKGKEIATDVLSSINTFLEDVFMGRAKLTWEKTLGWMRSIFAKFLADIITHALAQPIIIPVQMGMTSLGQLVGLTPQQNQATSLSPGSTLGGFVAEPGKGFITNSGSLLGFLTAPFMGYGIGSMVGSGWGGAVGGLIGYGLGTTSTAASIGASIGLGGQLGSVVPVIGTIVGALLGGLIGSLFEDEDLPKVTLEFTPDDLSRGVQGWNIRTWNIDFPDEAQQQYEQMFADMANTLKDFVEKIGGDVSKFKLPFEKMLEGFEDGKELQEAINEWITEYATFVTGIDFKQFQKSGEDLVNTVKAIVESVMIITNFGTEPIEAIYDRIQTTELSRLEQLRQLDKEIEETVKNLNSLSGLEYREGLEKIAGLIQQRYQLEIEYLTHIKMLTQSISQSIQQQIEQFQLDVMSPAEKVKYYNAKVQELYNQLLVATDPQQIEELVAKIQEYMSAGWSLLTEEEKQAAIDDAIAFLNEVNKIAQEKLNEAVIEQADVVKKLQEMLLNIDWTPLTELTTAAEDAANALTAFTSTLTTNSGNGSSYQHGLDYVPYNNFPAILHRGEAVITAKGNEALSKLAAWAEKADGSGQPVIIEIHGDVSSVINKAVNKATGKVINLFKRKGII